MRRLHGLLALLAASAAAWTVASTAEATGGIDTTYGLGGRAVVAGAPVSLPAGAAATPDGGAVLAGGDSESRAGIVLARFDAAGRPVRSFGRAGLVVRAGRVPGAVAVQPDGRVLAAGSAPGARSDRLALLRFDQRGRPDPTFGKRGETLRSFGDGRRPAAFTLLVLPDGRILVAGTETEEDVDIDYGRLLLARFLPDGRPDRDFGRDGAVRMRVARRTGAAVLGLAVTTDGGILAAGATEAFDADDDAIDQGVLLARFDSAGRPDRSFGGAGTGLVDLGVSAAQGSAVTTLPDGRALVAGSLEVPSRDPELGGSDALVVRVDRDGRLDRSFGRKGIVRLRAGDAGFAGASAMRVEADGTILLAGSATDCGSEDALVARLLPDGRFDRSFGPRGALLLPSETGEFNPAALLPLGEGRLLVAGVAGRGPGRLEAARVDQTLALPPDDGRPPKAGVGPLAPPKGARRITRVRVRVSLDEPATLKLSVRATVRIGSARIGRPLARGVVLDLPAGTRTVDLPVTPPEALGEMRASRLLALGCADDAAGNRARVRGTAAVGR